MFRNGPSPWSRIPLPCPLHSPGPPARLNIYQRGRVSAAWNFPPRTVFCKVAGEIFQVYFNLQKFRREEVSVKVTGFTQGTAQLVVECKHQERQDGDFGLVSRSFVCHPVIPHGYDLNGLQCTMSSEMILKLSVPKISAGNAVEDRVVKIVTEA